MKQKQEPKENPEQIEYREALKDMKDAELRIALRSRGLDPYELSQKDIDELRRLINKMQQIDAATKSAINAMQQKGNQEQMEISKEIEAIIQKVFAEQHPLPPTPAPGPDFQGNVGKVQPAPETPVPEGQPPEETAATQQEGTGAGGEWLGA